MAVGDNGWLGDGAIDKCVGGCSGLLFSDINLCHCLWVILMHKTE